MNIFDHFPKNQLAIAGGQGGSIIITSQELTAITAAFHQSNFTASVTTAITNFGGNNFNHDPEKLELICRLIRCLNFRALQISATGATAEQVTEQIYDIVDQVTAQTLDPNEFIAATIAKEAAAIKDVAAGQSNRFEHLYHVTPDFNINFDPQDSVAVEDMLARLRCIKGFKQLDDFKKVSRNLTLISQLPILDTKLHYLHALDLLLQMEPAMQEYMCNNIQHIAYEGRVMKLTNWPIVHPIIGEISPNAIQCETIGTHLWVTNIHDKIYDKILKQDLSNGCLMCDTNVIGSIKIKLDNTIFIGSPWEFIEALVQSIQNPIQHRILPHPYEPNYRMFDYENANHQYFRVIIDIVTDEVIGFFPTNIFSPEIKGKK